ncbi:hypothetical protein CDAR_611101, partial [Caerostris darwini]
MIMHPRRSFIEFYLQACLTKQRSVFMKNHVRATKYEPKSWKYNSWKPIRITPMLGYQRQALKSGIWSWLNILLHRSKKSVDEGEK